MAKTSIEWADRVWNPVVGCTPVSEGCRNCYAQALHNRRHQAFLEGKRMPVQYAMPFDQVQLLPGRLDQPLHWKKPARVFVNSMSDLFHEDVPDDFIWSVFSVMAVAERQQFLILTKRPQRMMDYLRQWEKTFVTDSHFESINIFLHSWPLPNVWLGVTAENQKSADERIPLLLQTPAAVRFVSVEPMLGAVDIHHYFPHNFQPGDAKYGWENQCSVIAPDGLRHCGYPPDQHPRPGINWVICGGESGPGARPMHPDWARGLRDQCQAAGVPFFFKQWGGWVSEYPQGVSMANRKQTFVHGREFYRVGKAMAGRMLDGQEWNEFPEEGK